MRITGIAAALIALTSAAAQPSFEVASVRISQLAKAGGEGSTRESIDPTPGRPFDAQRESALGHPLGV